MQRVTSARRLPEVLVGVALAVWVVFHIPFYSTLDFLGSPLGAYVNHVHQPLVIGLLMPAVLTRISDWSPLGLCAIAVAMAIVTYALQVMGDLYVVMLLLFLVAVQGMDVRRLLWVHILSTIVGLAFVEICTYAGGNVVRWLIPNGFYVGAEGFVHPNTFATVLTCTMMSMVLAFDRRRMWLPLVLLNLALSGFTYWVLSCRTSMVLHGAIALALLVERFARPVTRLIEDHPRLYVATLVGLALTFLVLIIIATVLYASGNELLALLNKLFTGRIKCASQVYEDTGGFTLFGRTVNYVNSFDARQGGLKSVILDCAYARYALNNGFATVACLLVIFVRACVVHSRKEPSFMLWAMLLILVVYAVIETGPTRLAFNGVLLYLAEGVAPGRLRELVAARVDTRTGDSQGGRPFGIGTRGQLPDSGSRMGIPLSAPVARDGRLLALTPTRFAHARSMDVLHAAARGAR